MNDREIRDVMSDLLAQAGQPVQTGELVPTMPLTEGGLELTSLELVRLLVGLESQLGIQFDDEEVMNATLGVVDDVVVLVRDSLAATHVG